MSSHRREKGGGEPGDDARLSNRKQKRKPRPLDAASLRDLALSYVARFSTTGAKLEQYCARKLRERGVAEDADGRTVELDVKAMVAQFIELGYIDDDAYARSKSRDLTARGYGARRVEQALYAAGVDEDVRSGNAPGEAEGRRAAMLLAKKRRFGPFARGFGDGAGEESARETGEDLITARKTHDKQVAAMLRAGHSFAHIQFILDAGRIEDIEDWIDEALGEDPDEGAGLW